MSKYAPLEEFLISQKESPVSLSYAEMENLLGFKLPSSAYKHRAWWSNGKKGGSKVWLRAGWLVDTVRMGETVAFRRATVAETGAATKVETVADEDVCDIMISLDLADIPLIIKDLQGLLVDGIISKEEFAEKKANLLSLI